MRLAVYNGSEWQRKHAKGFARWYIHNYIPKSIHPKLSVSICLYDSPKEWKKIASDKNDLGYCEYIDEDRQLGLERCRITLYSPKNLLYYRFIVRLAHEFVHAKQYIMHELKEYSNSTTFKKQKFKDGEQIYWNQPWEVEAFGYEGGLAKLYCEEAKIKHEVFTAEVKRIIC